MRFFFDAHGRLAAATALAMTALTVVSTPAAADPDQPATTSPPDLFWAVHVQGTEVMQYHPAFRSPYRGPNSLTPGQEVGNTIDGSVFVGFRPWKGAEFWADLDMNQGFAPSNTLGVDGYVNGEGAKVGAKYPYIRPQRQFYRQTIELGGGEDEVDPDMFEFGGKTTKNRLVFTIGKFSLTDFMDDNQYAHDPKNDFLNWAIIDTGTFDYAADAWGFSYGGLAEWYEGDWTFRGAMMDLSTVPNDPHLTPNLTQFQLDGEIERRENWLGRQGKVKLLVFATHGRMGRFDDAVALAQATGQPANLALVRQYRTRVGVSLNIEQSISDNAGLFLRAGWAQGQYEGYEYTDMDATVAAGASITGAKWGRKDDTVALALVMDGASKAQQDYLAAGGLGILVGDGRLPHPGVEMILETYYSLAVIDHVHLTVDSQTVVNPGFNRDRGPAEVIGLRLHGQY